MLENEGLSKYILSLFLKTSSNAVSFLVDTLLDS